MGRRGTFADFINISNGFHPILLHFIIDKPIISKHAEKYNGLNKNLSAQSSVQILDRCVKIECNENNIPKG
jgi:hypothetical protein